MTKTRPVPEKRPMTEPRPMTAIEQAVSRLAGSLAAGEWPELDAPYHAPRPVQGWNVAFALHMLMLRAGVDLPDDVWEFASVEPLGLSPRHDNFPVKLPVDGPDLQGIPGFPPGTYRQAALAVCECFLKSTGAPETLPKLLPETALTSGE